MFKTVLSTYITTNMDARGWKLKDMSRESTLPDSTINAYILQKTNNPSDANLILIAKAFGDPPEVIWRMRREAYQVDEAEAKMLSEAVDKKKIEAFAEAVRTMLSSMMEDFRVAFSAQQTEIIQNSSDLNEKVAQQCKAELERKDKDCTEKLDLMEKHCSQRIDDMRAHMQDVLKEKGDSEDKLMNQYARNRNYFIKTILCFGAIIFILLTTNVFFGAYAIFAYTVFDMNDPTRGLHREHYSIGPMMLFLAIVALVAAILIMVWLYVNRTKDEEHKELKKGKQGN